MNLTIRRAEPSDYEAIAKIFTYPKVVWGTLQLPYPSVEAWRKRLAEPPEGFYSLVACIATEVVGQIALHTFPNAPRRRHTGQIGMMVRDDWQGKGVGTALMQAVVDLADKWLNLRRLELDVYVDNEPALKLYKKFGFEIEGRQVDEAFRDGIFVDTYHMARLHR
ncbi:MAG: GNAT family N-acetyltransferase [Chloroflexi bacterium]|nr:GNAT family N-acetyltransferase [Chloroflexota bacterium]